MNTSIGIIGISDMLDRINEVSSIDEILALIKKIDALKAALEAAETFRQQSIMYAKLEANALIRAVELGGLSKLRGTHKPTAEWLYGLSEQERDKYITMCEDGLTIDQVYKREIGDARKLNEQIKEVEYWRNSLLEDSKKNGIVDMKPFVEKVREVFKGDKRQIGNDIIDGTRNRLRQSGAVGIGGDTGIYVTPKPETQEEIKKAIVMRYESICNDYNSIKKIAKASGVKISYKEFDSGDDFTYCRERYIPHIMIALWDMGVIADEEALSDAIDRSDFYKEMDWVLKYTGLSRKKYIKIQYDKYFGERSETEEIET